MNDARAVLASSLGSVRVLYCKTAKTRQRMSWNAFNGYKRFFSASKQISSSRVLLFVIVIGAGRQVTKGTNIGTGAEIMLDGVTSKLQMTPTGVSAWISTTSWMGLPVHVQEGNSQIKMAPQRAHPLPLRSARTSRRRSRKTGSSRAIGRQMRSIEVGSVGLTSKSHAEASRKWRP